MKLVNDFGINTSDQKFFNVFKDKPSGSHKRIPTALAWNSKGDRLATAECFLRVWAFDEMQGLEKMAETKVHDNNVEHLEFCNNNILGSLSRDAIKFWDIRENVNRAIKTEKKSKSDFLSFSWNHSNETGSPSPLLTVVNKDGVVNVLDFRKVSQPLHTLSMKNLNSFEINKAVWDRSDSVLFCAGGENTSGSLILFDGTTFECIPEPPLTIHCSKITDLTFDKQNFHLATASEDSLVQIHEIPDLVCERVYSNKSDGSFKKVSFSCNGNYLAASSQEPTINIYNIECGGLAYQLNCSNSQECLQWHPSKMVLAYIDEEERKKSLDKGEMLCIHLFASP